MLSVSLFIILYFGVLFGLVFGVRMMRDQRQKLHKIDLEQLTVIVPFRNEAKHIKQFLACIKKQHEQPKAWIFVNDHSDDATSEHIAAFIEDHPRVFLVDLPEEDEGKKMAIRFGLLEVETPYFITMDADVRFGEDYIAQLAKLPEADMLILPVQMLAKKWWQVPFQLEFNLTQLINKGVSGWKRPVNASGANLFFNKDTFEEVDDIDTHAHIASGDDMYALRAFRNNEKSVFIVEHPALMVTTDTPDSFSEIMDQRLRWMQKTSDVGDKLNNALGIAAVIFHSWYFLLQIITFFGNAMEMTLVLLLVKGMIDYALLQLDIKSWNFKLFLGLVLFEAFYPIYLLLLMVSSVFSQPEWKGR